MSNYMFLNYLILFSSFINHFTRRAVLQNALTTSIVSKGNIYNDSQNDLNNNLNNNFENYGNLWKYEKNNNNYINKNIEFDENSDEYKTIIHVENNDIYIYGPITPEGCFHLEQYLIKLAKVAIQNDEYNPRINLHIQSMGGTLLPAFGVIDLIQSSQVPVDTYISGFAASAASLISVSGKKRYMTKNSMMLIHSLRTTIGEVNYNQLEDQFLNSQSMMNLVKNIYKENSYISDDKLEYLLEHDFWLNSSECLKYKLVDSVIW